MPKIIVKIKHLKTSKSVGNFVNYIAKRDSVDMSDKKDAKTKAT